MKTLEQAQRDLAEAQQAEADARAAKNDAAAAALAAEQRANSGGGVGSVGTSGWRAHLAAAKARVERTDAELVHLEATVKSEQAQRDHDAAKLADGHDADDVRLADWDTAAADAASLLAEADSLKEQAAAKRKAAEDRIAVARDACRRLGVAVLPAHPSRPEYAPEAIRLERHRHVARHEPALQGLRRRASKARAEVEKMERELADHEAAEAEALEHEERRRAAEERRARRRRQRQAGEAL